MDQIFDSEYCKQQNAERFRNRLVFPIGLLIGARTTELWILEVSQFRCECIDCKPSYVYYQKLDRAKKSRNHRGVKYVNHRPRSIPIANIPMLSGKLNVLQLFKSYFQAREKCNVADNQILLVVDIGLEWAEDFEQIQSWRNPLKLKRKKCAKRTVTLFIRASEKFIVPFFSLAAAEYPSPSTWWKNSVRIRKVLPMHLPHVQEFTWFSMDWIRASWRRYLNLLKFQS